MAKISVLAGSTGVSVNLFINSSTSTTGAGQSGIVFNAASFTAYSIRQRTTATPITLATSTVGNGWTSGGFIEIDSTHCPGWYNFDIPNAVIGTGSPFASVHFQGAAGMAPLPLEIELTAWNNQDGVRGGLTSLSTAVPGAVNGLMIAGTNSACTVNIVGTHTGNLTGSVGSVVGSVGSVTTGVTSTSVTDKSGYILSTGTHTNAVIPTVNVVQTATVNNLTSNALSRYFDTDAGTYATSSANSVVKQIADNAIGAGGAPTVAQIATAVWAKFGTGTVMLSTGTHVGAVIPTVNSIQTSADGRMANLDATVSSRAAAVILGTSTSADIATGLDAIRAKTGNLPSAPAATGDAMALTSGERTTLATVITTSSLTESYRGTGAGGSVAQMLYEIQAHVGNFVLVGTATSTGDGTKSLLKVDGTTTAATFLITSTAAPSGIKRNA